LKAGRTDGYERRCGQAYVEVLVERLRRRIVVQVKRRYTLPGIQERKARVKDDPGLYQVYRRRLYRLIGRQRDLIRVAGQPLLESLKLRIQGSGELEIPRAGEVVVEVALELEHVAEVVRPGEPEASVHVGRRKVVGTPRSRKI
jgi:hypothetical protein